MNTIPITLTVSKTDYSLDLSVDTVSDIPMTMDTAIQIVNGHTYQGDYTVTPTESEQVLETQDLVMENDLTVEAIPSDYIGTDVPRKDSDDMTVSGPTVTAPAGYYEEASSKSVASGAVSVPNTSMTVTPSIDVSTSGLITALVSSTKTVSPSVTEGYVTGGTPGTVTAIGTNTSQLDTQASATISPTESEQTAVTSGKYTTGEVKVGAIPSNYVGSSVIQRSSADLTASGDTITAPSGYYASNASKSVQSGTATTPATSITANPSVSIDSNGLITATVSASKSVTPTVSAGYITSGTPGTVTVSGTGTSQLTKRTSSSLTASGATVTAPAGYYPASASKAVSSGTEGTPTATKGTVSSNQVSVTPSVTNSEGYIAGGTKTGTPVTVSASELVSGTKSISANGTGIDVTNFASVDVAVPAGTPNLQSKSKSYTPTESAQTETVSSDAGYDGLDEVEITVGAISSTYIGSGVTQRDSSDLSASGATVTAPSGYYANAATKTISSGTATPATSISDTGATVSTGTNTLTLSKTVSNTPQVSAGYISAGTAGNTSVSLTASVNTRTSSDLSASGATVTAPAGYYASNATKTVTSGTAGTPTATKGTVNNHSVSVTPSVTNTTGYITGGTKTGTAVSVAASELVSGSETKTANGTYDVSNLAQIVVNVSGGGGVSTDTKTTTASNYPTSLSFTSMKGEPKMFTVRLNAQVSSSGSTTYYYIVDITSHGTTTHGNCFRIGSTRRVDNITSGYSWSYSGTTLTVTSSAASRSASPGAFYNGSYELMYVY